MQKNVASQKFVVFAFDSTTNLPKSGDSANITAYISKDFGAVTALGDTSATEMDATNAKGYYLFDATQTETNADIILVSGKSSTANIVVVGAPAAIFTTPANFTADSIDSNGRRDVIKVAGTTQTARDLGANCGGGTGPGLTIIRKNGATSNVIRVKLRRLDTNQGLTGLAYNTSGLTIASLCDNESISTTYAADAGKTETVAALGTYAAPTATKCRFAEVESSNQPGVYEIHLADARFAVSGAKIMRLSIFGAANLRETEVIVQLSSLDLDTASVAQTGDSYARIGATGSGLTSLAQSSAYTSTRAGYLDNINNSGLSILEVGRDGAVRSTNRGYISDAFHATPWLSTPAVTYYVRTNGSDSNGGTNPTDDAFLTIAAAITARNADGQANGKIDIAGAYTTSAQIIVPTNTWLCGDGSTSRSGTTSITSSYASTNAAVTALDGAIISGIYIATTVPTTQIRPPIGYGSGDTAGRNVAVYDIDTYADSDGALFSRTTAHNGYWRFHNCTFSYKWDGATIVGEGSTAVVDYYNCTWTQTGASTATGATDTRAITATGGKQRFFNCTITATTHVTGKLAYPVYVRGCGTVELYNCTLTGPTSQPTDGYQLLQTDRAKLIVFGLTHTNSTYSTSGTIIDGEAGVDWSKTRNVTSTKNFSGTTIKNTTDISTKLGTPAGASVSADIAAIDAGGGGGPVEHTPVPSARILQVKDRGDGTFGVNGRVRMRAGETLWWAVDLKGTQLAAGDLVDAVDTPTVTGANAANLTTPSYGVFGTLVKFKCLLSGSASTSDVININLPITPDGVEALKVVVPVTVGA